MPATYIWVNLNKWIKLENYFHKIPSNLPARCWSPHRGATSDTPARCREGVTQDSPAHCPDGCARIETENCHDANSVVTGGTVGCRYDNRRYWQNVTLGYQWIRPTGLEGSREFRKSILKQVLNDRLYQRLEYLAFKVLS